MKILIDFLNQVSIFLMNFSLLFIFALCYFYFLFVKEATMKLFEFNDLSFFDWVYNELVLGDLFQTSGTIEFQTFCSVRLLWNSQFSLTPCDSFFINPFNFSCEVFWYMLNIWLYWFLFIDYFFDLINLEWVKLMLLWIR